MLFLYIYTYTTPFFMKKYKIINSTDKKHIGSIVLVDIINKVCYIGKTKILDRFDFIKDDGTKLRIMNSNYTLTVKK